MILEIKKWCEGLIVAVILCIIIESLIPNGNNKKYIKVVIGIYVMYVTLTPILSLLNYEIDLKDIFIENDSYEEVSYSLDNNIKEIYILGIEENIKNEIKELGYEIKYVKVFVDINYENIEKIELEIKNIDNITDSYSGNLVIIDDKVYENKNYDEVVDYLTKNYSIEKEKIIFK